MPDDPPATSTGGPAPAQKLTLEDVTAMLQKQMVANEKMMETQQLLHNELQDLKEQQTASAAAHIEKVQSLELQVKQQKLGTSNRTMTAAQDLRKELFHDRAMQWGSMQGRIAVLRSCIESQDSPVQEECLTLLREMQRQCELAVAAETVGDRADNIQLGSWAANVYYRDLKGRIDVGPEQQKEYSKDLLDIDNKALVGIMVTARGKAGANASAGGSSTGGGSNNRQFPYTDKKRKLLPTTQPSGPPAGNGGQTPQQNYSRFKGGK